MDNATELRITKYIIGEIFSAGGATLYKNPSDQTVIKLLSSSTILVRDWKFALFYEFLVHCAVATRLLWSLRPNRYDNTNMQSVNF